MNKTIYIAATVLGTLAVLFGAFGAHGLEKLVTPKAVESFETGVRYQIYHAFFLFILGLLPNLSTKQKKIVYSLILTGIILFSFSIYLLALNSLIEVDFRKIAFLTPLGGSLLIAGWTTLGYHLVRSKIDY
ncbi:DUF423 domain-containing protein [Maribacter sp. 2304DJ31-5]|uniref:DUF423 domain-containing protein n=1 Tax=Maribacter sp. 2304DJ31-5 TaxID=3386273 RepID=UPI0039BD602C